MVFFFSLFCSFFLKISFSLQKEEDFWKTKQKKTRKLGPHFDSKKANLGPHFDSTAYMSLSLSAALVLEQCAFTDAHSLLHLLRCAVIKGLHLRAAENLPQELSKAFYADAVRRVNLLTLAFALYCPAFERWRSTRSLALFLTQPFFGPFYARRSCGLKQRFTQVTPALRKCKFTHCDKLRPNAPVNPYAA